MTSPSVYVHYVWYTYMQVEQTNVMAITLLLSFHLQTWWKLHNSALELVWACYGTIEIIIIISSLQYMQLHK